jgi:hypothetical protein
MIKTLPLVTPKSALGAALAYMQNLWPLLTRYTERHDLPIDNNRAHAASGMSSVMPRSETCRVEVARRLFCF